MEQLGRVAQLWRYPVKSMGGEALEAARVTARGVAGDRQWAVLDEEGVIRSARQWPRLIELAASYAEGESARFGGFDRQVPEVCIRWADGREARSDTAELETMLAEHLGHPCRLAPVQPPSNRAFYRHPTAPTLDNLDEELDRQEGEPDFDFSQTSEEMFALLTEYMAPPGTFFDSYPLHLLSTQVLSYLDRESEADINPRRFRPNLIIDFDQLDGDVPEFDLVGSRLQVGEAIISLQARTIRCSIPSRPQPVFGLEQDGKMTRTMVRLMERHIGVYAQVEREGAVSCGDPVLRLP